MHYDFALSYIFCAQGRNGLSGPDAKRCRSAGDAVDVIRSPPVNMAWSGGVGRACGPRASIQLAAADVARSADRVALLESVRRQAILDSAKHSHPRSAVLFVSACARLCCMSVLVWLQDYCWDPRLDRVRGASAGPDDAQPSTTCWRSGRI